MLVKAMERPQPPRRQDGHPPQSCGQRPELTELQRDMEASRG